MPLARTETAALGAADGRVSAAAVVSGIDVPPFDRAAMDGYAVRSADLAAASTDAPVALTCEGEVFTGDSPGRLVSHGHCLAISTGAPLPDGADAVVMVEHTSRAGDDIRIATAARTGQNIDRAGGDLRRGDLVVERDDVLGPARIGCLAAVGLTHVEVFGQPSIAVLSTGNEVTAPGRPLPPGHVYDVNRFTIEAVTRRHGGTVTAMPAAGDSVEALTEVLDRAAAHDAIVFSGGSSVGGRDVTLDALRAAGTIVFHGVAVKPGKPTLFGRVGQTPVFGMPGNPTSCLSNAYLLLVPFVRRLARLPAWQPLRVTARLTRSIRSTRGRHQFYPVRVADGEVEPAFKSSGHITSMARADGFIEIPTDVAGLEAGSLVTVTLI